ncbi:integrase core domain protein [Escherichia coli 6-319-05_S4_C3]|nr:integrase core domain protein [Escherichia coli 6-319-05_S4_C3]
MRDLILQLSKSSIYSTKPRQDYNECRPHSTLNYQTPSEFAAGWRKGHSENEDSDVTN